MTRQFFTPCLRACVPACLLLLAACSSDPTRGYSLASTYAQDIRSVSVPIFENTTFFRGMEIELTDAIIKEIQRTTPWVVVQGSGQTTLTGSITDTQLHNLSTKSGTGLVEEMGVQTTVDFEWRDARTGKVLVSRKAFKAMETFVPARGTSERIELGQHAVVQELARGIVAELRTTW
jgi:lipopolysaccharide assembly LptE-like protein